MPIPFAFDFKKPDYIQVFEYRQEMLDRLRDDPQLLFDTKVFYRDHPAQFITDWGMTSDPRNPEIGLPTLCPFLLFPRQEEWIEWTMECWKNREPGATHKSREMGVSWLMCGLASTLCLFNDGLNIGFGSRKQEYVDKLGDPKSLFYKVRQFVELLPKEFTGSFDIRKHAPHMRILFPDTHSIISGEAGDGIGRGDRTSMYMVDEAGWLSHPDLVEASLSQTTNCRIDVSTPNGPGGPFARKIHEGIIKSFHFHWRDDPRKDQEWYDRKCVQLGDPVVIAQEIDGSFLASVDCVLIPNEWVQSAIDAHTKLGITPSGIRKAGLDIADEGKDKNAICGRHGILLEYLESWTGKGSDIYKTVEKVCLISDLMSYPQIDYDADGVGAEVRGDARVINSTRQVKILFEPFRGSGAVCDPEDDPFERFLTPTQKREKEKLRDKKSMRTNDDFFANAKAQAWWVLRQRFLNTYRAIQGQEYNVDDIISISKNLPELNTLIMQLSQPTFSQNNVGKILIDKAPDGCKSPDLADAVMIAFAPFKKPSLGVFHVYKN